MVNESKTATVFFSFFVRLYFALGTVVLIDGDSELFDPGAFVGGVLRHGVIDDVQRLAQLLLVHLSYN